ncbi:hypothetical protein [Achromobacter anxifer]|uniref:hypothetical protein n=1 Tax=Achromobacter anxifer TaxID=1287737 RepID=UPI002157F5C6|nr:hypothetical protein [Achromobacter anxifer]
MLHHPLTQDPWSIDTNLESSPVSLSHLHQIDRARYAIQTIARMVGNSASEPDATGSPPLDAWSVAALMGGVEGLCEHVATLTDAMLEQALHGEGGANADDAMHDALALIR